MVPSALYERWGINLDHLKAILKAKLMMDDRRPNTLQASRGTQAHKEIKNATLGSMLLGIVMGLMYLVVFALGNDYITQFTLYFTLFLTFMSMALVSDFTAVLIDVRDTQIILPKPVNDRTFVMSRLLHVFIHICKLVIPMTLPCFVYLIFFKHQLGAGFIYGLMVLLITLFSIFLINAVYIVILRVTTPSKFKSIIGYIQIVFAVLVYGGYQVAPRMIDQADLSNFTLIDTKWLIFAPPYWFAAGFNTLVTGQASTWELLATGLALVVPVLSIYIVMKYLAPAFNQKLAMISGSDSSEAAVKPATKAAKSGGVSDLLSRIFTRSKAEKAGFLFTWKMMARSRDFKMRVYPSIGYLLVLLVTGIFRSRNEAQEGGRLDLSFRPLIILYVSSVILIAAIAQIRHSEKYKAAWVFFITPLKAPGEVINGSIKAALAQFLLIIIPICFAIGLWMAGPEVLPNMLLALCNLLVITYLIVVMNVKRLPFSEPADAKAQGGQATLSLFVMLFAGIISVLHYFAFRSPIAIGIVFVLSITALWALMHSVRNITWESMPNNAE